MQCTAKNRSGEQCKRNATRGMTVCNLHGGKSPKGEDSPSFKHGNRSRHYRHKVVGKIAENYEQALNDPDYLALKSEIALLDSRINELTVNIKGMETARLWAELGKVNSRVRYASRTGNADELRAALGDLDTIVGQGQGERVAWIEITDLIERRRRLTDSEQRWQIAREQTITVERFMALVGMLIGSINRHVKNPDEREQVAKDIDRLLIIND